MGGTTIRRLAKRKDVDASVQRFVIPAADVCRVSILAAQPNEVELVFACIEHIDRPSERDYRTNHPFDTSVLTVLAASTLIVAHWTSMSVALFRISSRSRPHGFAFRQSVVAR